jgi:hypothetical protein
MKGLVTLDEPETSFMLEWDARDNRKAEVSAAKTFGFAVGTSAEVIAKAVPNSYLALIVYSAAKRQGLFDGSFADWNTRYVDTDIDEASGGDGLPDPTRPDHGTVS